MHENIDVWNTDLIAGVVRLHGRFVFQHPGVIGWRLRTNHFQKVMNVCLRVHLLAAHVKDGLEPTVLLIGLQQQNCFRPKCAPFRQMNMFSNL